MQARARGADARRPHRAAHERRRMERGDDGARAGDDAAARADRGAARRGWRSSSRCSSSSSTKASRCCSIAAADSDSPPAAAICRGSTQRVDGGTIFPGNGGSRDAQGAGSRCRRRRSPSSTTTASSRLLEHGQPVRMEVNIQTKFHPETDRGRQRLQHHRGDSRHRSRRRSRDARRALRHAIPTPTGATDNATGSAAMMEAVRVIQALGLKPRRTIRVALWAAEEQGLLGSRAYVQQHFYDADDQAPRSRNTRRCGLLQSRQRHRPHPRHLGPGQHRRDEDVRGVGPAAEGPRLEGREPAPVTSDRSRARSRTAGLPGFQFIQERLEYNSRTHHSNMDTFDHVQPDDLMQQGAVAAVFAW